MRSLVVLSGNPRTPSKTSATAVALADAITARVAAPPQVDVIELAELGPAVLEAGRADVAAAQARVASAGLVIVATPVYKGSYTGLLKAFLDGYGPTSLAGVAAIPLVIAASPAHTTLAAEIHLRPVLHEVGAETPFGALALLDAKVADATARDELLSEWVDARLALFAAVAAAEEVPA